MVICIIIYIKYTSRYRENAFLHGLVAIHRVSSKKKKVIPLIISCIPFICFLFYISDTTRSFFPPGRGEIRINHCDSALSLTSRLLGPHSLGEEILLGCWLYPLTHWSQKFLPSLGGFLSTEEASMKDPCWKKKILVMQFLVQSLIHLHLTLHQKPQTMVMELTTLCLITHGFQFSLPSETSQVLCL